MRMQMAAPKMEIVHGVTRTDSHWQIANPIASQHLKSRIKKLLSERAFLYH